MMLRGSGKTCYVTQLIVSFNVLRNSRYGNDFPGPKGRRSLSFVPSAAKPAASSGGNGAEDEISCSHKCISFHHLWLRQGLLFHSC